MDGFKHVVLQPTPCTNRNYFMTCSYFSYIGLAYGSVLSPDSMGKSGKNKKVKPPPEPPREMVRVHKWMSRQEIADKYGASRVDTMIDGVEVATVDGVELFKVVVAVLAAEGETRYQ